MWVVGKLLELSEGREGGVSRSPKLCWRAPWNCRRSWKWWLHQDRPCPAEVQCPCRTCNSITSTLTATASTVATTVAATVSTEITTMHTQKTTVPTTTVNTHALGPSFLNIFTAQSSVFLYLCASRP